MKILIKLAAIALNVYHHPLQKTSPAEHLPKSLLKQLSYKQIVSFFASFSHLRFLGRRQN